jgi:uncharacterized damage-inducible protein DinB
MTWTAPQVVRTDPGPVDDERTSLDGWLDYHRGTLLAKCAGLTAAQLKTRSVPPSNLSLLGLVRHMSEVERWWFRRRAAGEEIGPVYPSDTNEDAEDAEFDEIESADAEGDLATFGEECQKARETAAPMSLDQTFFHPRHNCDMSMRWVYVHMIEEYARHNGHADLLRECLDGVTGE